MADSFHPRGFRIRNYQILEAIDVEEFAVVHRGRDNFTGEDFGIKIFEKTTLNQETEKKLLENVSFRLKLDHPNVSTLYDFIVEEDKFYLITDLTYKGILASQFMKDGGLSEANAANVFLQACKGVSYLRSQGITPNNITLYNLPMTLQLVVKLDFDLETRFNDNYEKNYILPGMVSDPRENIGVVSNLGRFLYSLLVGHPPFRALAPIYQVNGAFYQIPARLSNEARDLINRSLNVIPAQRISLMEIQLHPFINTQSSPQNPKFEGEIPIIRSGNLSVAQIQQDPCAHLTLTEKNLSVEDKRSGGENIERENNVTLSNIEKLVRVPPFCTAGLKPMCLRFDNIEFCISEDGLLKLSLFTNKRLDYTFTVSMDGQTIRILFLSNDKKKLYSSVLAKQNYKELVYNYEGLPSFLKTIYWRMAYCIELLKTKN